MGAMGFLSSCRFPGSVTALFARLRGDGSRAVSTTRTHGPAEGKGTEDSEKQARPERVADLIRQLPQL